MPTLEEALALLTGSDTALLLDLKETGNMDLAGVVDLVRRYGAPGSTMFGVRSVRGKGPEPFPPASASRIR